MALSGWGINFASTKLSHGKIIGGVVEVVEVGSNFSVSG
jgi:hypothetical protein